MKDGPEMPKVSWKEKKKPNTKSKSPKEEVKYNVRKEKASVDPAKEEFDIDKELEMYLD